MNFDEFDSNSKNTEKRVKISSPGNFVKKNPKINDITNYITNDMDSIKESVIHNIFIPGIKDLINGLIDHIFCRNGTARGYSQSFFNNAYTSYNAQYNQNYSYGFAPFNGQNPYNQPNMQGLPNIRSNFDYRNLSWPNRGSAEKALYSMNEILRQYMIVSVADLFEIAGHTPTGDPTGSSYGWNDLTGSQVIRNFNGSYTLKLPPIRPINTI